MQIFPSSILPAWAALQSISETFTLFSLPPETPRFDPTEATIQSVHRALYANITQKDNRLTCREVITAFLNQIDAYNPLINAIISLDAGSLSVADELDAQLIHILNENTYNDTHKNYSSIDDVPLAFNPSSLPSLFCIPVLLKDNFDTANVSTTAGCAALYNSTPPLHDSPVVKALREAGAVILGKTNMHEMALEGLTVSSLGGQTLNPYDRSRTPGGSSGGTGAAIAASFAVFGLGTDTVNSLRSPASANSLFSLRPTRGLISRAGVFPVSYTQDTVGPIARDLDYTELLPRDQALRRNDSLKGVRFGLLEGFINRTDTLETTPVNTAIDAMVSKLEKAGAVVVPIRDRIYNSTTILNLDVQVYEYREMVDSYLRSLGHAASTGARTLADIYAQVDGEDPSFLVIPHQYNFIQSALVSSPQNISYAQKQLSINALTLAVKQTFSSHNLDALIYPQQQNLPVKLGSQNQYGRNGILAALTGCPVITVPAGFSRRDVFRNIPVGVPVGMEVMGLPWEEERLLSIAARIEALEKIRRPPKLKREKGKGSGYNRVMNSVPRLVPNRLNIHDAYPLGVFE
ncbi:amidase [Microsporum canis CBS 113480]|uniref:Amidase n=1 Tax=Arthroderma otae (strain ATCC MYA-4605 / CBS 113480) TaxID=554155 RepID=C5FXF3_ARTOC|nr:amidase [Microsporum canis CBS 113480]EEQ34993.1 amidase [Microsporum canis CBS 113480]